jgi:hypothetical protein
MSQELMALGAIVSSADIGNVSGTERLALEQGIRASLLCALLGVEREEWVWEFPALAAGGGASASGPVKMLAGVFEPLDGIGHLATLAGAADIDPMDPGPSHTVLPATLASCVAATLDASGRRADHGDLEVGSGVLAGVEAGWRLRRAISGTRPGVGFHSPGVFGAVAAAAAAARTLRLGAEQCANALAIALTRASGLAINSAASMIGMTHFGWGAAHGLEAALLASQGWDASHDVQRALSSLFGEGRVDPAAITNDYPGPSAAVGLVFKRYPCNIYLNLVVLMLEEVKERPVDRVEIKMPWIPHLDCANPRDIRQARNSAQAVAAIAGAGDASYAAFSGPRGPWMPAAEVMRLIENVELVADRSAPTRLSEAVVGLRAWRGGSLVQDGTRAMRDLRGWGVEHARRLMGADDASGGVEALYGGSFIRGFEHVKKRRLAGIARRRTTP